MWKHNGIPVKPEEMFFESPVDLDAYRFILVVHNDNTHTTAALDDLMSDTDSWDSYKYIPSNSIFKWTCKSNHDSGYGILFEADPCRDYEFQGYVKQFIMDIICYRNTLGTSRVRY